MDETESPVRAAALDWVLRPRQVVLPPGPPSSPRPWARSEPTTMHVRGAGVDDADALAAMHERCSMDTIFRRYLCAAPALSRAWQLRLLATTVALVAVDAHGRVRALGNIARLDDAGTAELAVLVEDSFQGRGLGTAVVRHLAAAARLAGFRALRADVLPSSIAAMRAAAHLGPAASVVGHGVVTLTIPLRVEAVAGLSVA